MKALILAAGLGTRLRPITDSLPKALAPVDGVPLLERNLRQLASQGVSEFIVNVHYKAEQVLEFLQRNNNFGLRITISDERERLLNTGGALKKAAWFFDDGQPFLIYNVDIITSLDVRKLRTYHTENGALATVAVSHRSASRFFLLDAQHRVHGWRNVKTGEEKRPWPTTEPLVDMGFGGIHVASPELLPHLQNFGEVFSIIELYLSLAAKHPIVGYDMLGEEWVDVGKPETLAKAELILQKNRA
ncbi:MAG: nucleotidyltransferase family protein [Prevotellaceae bacterium]|nr:nucleotidyltransferase family protein [Prevotellaceae bacterium]